MRRDPTPALRKPALRNPALSHSALSESGSRVHGPGLRSPGLFALLVLDGLLLGAIGLALTPMYAGAVPTPVGALLSIALVPWLVPYIHFEWHTARSPSSSTSVVRVM